MNVRVDLVRIVAQASDHVLECLVRPQGRDVRANQMVVLQVRLAWRRHDHGKGVSPVPFEFYTALPYSEWPFVWFPLAGQRHAINRQDRTVRMGSPMRTLCGNAHPRRPAGDVEWLWPTCEPCWDEACTILGIPPHR